MGISASRMAETVVPVTVAWGDESAEVLVRPGRITREMLRAADEATADTLIDQTLAIVERWDVLDGEGERLPVTREVVERLPYAFLGAVITAAVGAVAAQGKASPATS